MQLPGIYQCILRILWIWISVTATGYVNASYNHHRWLRTEVMDGNGLYILDWKVLGKDIIFRVTVNTQGFIGLGFSRKTGKMANSDLVLAWVDDRTGKPNVLDCYGSPLKDGGAPIQDDTQNYIIEEGFQNGTHTQIQFRRPLETCDPHDIPLGMDTIKVLWSYGNKDPIFDKLSGHGNNRGSKSFHLMSPMARKPTHNRDIRSWDVTVKNVSIESNMDTLYWCKILKAPLLQDKHHIIGYEALISKDRYKKSMVHHITLFECSTSSYPGADPLSWEVWVKSNGAVCNSNLLTPRDWDSCITPIAVWAVGSTGQFLPHHVGIPMGGRTGAKYYMLEIHYDNPVANKMIDHSGFRIHYTRRLRDNDGGMMISGVSVSDTQMIPPQQKLYRNVGICGPSCTGLLQMVYVHKAFYQFGKKPQLEKKHRKRSSNNPIFPDDGIKIISATLHSHVAGRKMKLRHVRDGIELNRIVEDDNYDYNYQQVKQLINETTILPGDYMITDCAYETIGRKRPTFGGYSTKQEMCLSFITYYPKIDLAGCYSMTPVKEFFETFGVHEFYAMNMTDVENLFLYNGNALDLMPTTIFPNGPPDGGHIDDEHNRKAIEALRNAKEYSIIDDEDALQRESILNKLIISDPVEFHDRTFLAHLNQLPWSEPLFTRVVEQTMLMGKHMTFCRVSNESLSVSSEIIRYPNFTILARPPSHCPYHHMAEIVSSGNKKSSNSILMLILTLIFIYNLQRYQS